jgi:hypothetical protein
MKTKTNVVADGNNFELALKFSLIAPITGLTAVEVPHNKRLTKVNGNIA